MERVKFLSILGSNLDEFFMVRAPELIGQTDGRIAKLEIGGPAQAADFEGILAEVGQMQREARRHLHDELAPALAAAGIHILNYADLTPRERAGADAHFTETILPLLMPLAFDRLRPFPHIANLGLNLAVLIRDRKGVERFAQVRVPDAVPHLVPVHISRRSRRRGRASKHVTIEQGFVWLEQLIAANLAGVFPGMEIVEAHPFRVTKDAEIQDRKLEAAELLDGIEDGVRWRHFGAVTRLSVGEGTPPRLLEILTRNLKLAENAGVYHTRCPLALVRLMELTRIDRPELHDPPLRPRVPAGLAAPRGNPDLFEAMRRGDVLLHHPYESFQPVVDFFQQAARDPDVLAIRTTLYRVGRHSPVVKALLDAQRHGKQVGVVVELRARFDEESNVGWVRALERAGAHVTYGMAGLKVHAKTALVLRREGNKIRRYVHLSSGNYNDVTSRIYTDFGLLTCDGEIGADATDLFNFLTGFSAPESFRKLIVAPTNLRARLREMIQREVSWQRQGESGHLIFKLNALVDEEMIQLLYQASQAGVRIDLIVRGICCLRPGVSGVSENIRVRSIVGRFLEHSRAYYFRNGGSEEIYLGSADLMPRNLNRRVEVLFPIQDASLCRRIRDEILAVCLADNVKARELMSDGSYVRVSRRAGEAAVSSQDRFLNASNP